MHICPKISKKKLKYQICVVEDHNSAFIKFARSIASLTFGRFSPFTSPVFNLLLTLTTAQNRPSYRVERRKIIRETISFLACEIT